MTKLKAQKVTSLPWDSLSSPVKRRDYSAWFVMFLTTLTIYIANKTTFSSGQYYRLNHQDVAPMSGLLIRPHSYSSSPKPSCQSFQVNLFQNPIFICLCHSSGYGGFQISKISGSWASQSFIQSAQTMAVPPLSEINFLQLPILAPPNKSICCYAPLITWPASIPMSFPHSISAI